MSYLLNKNMNRLFSSVPQAVTNESFKKALLYSFGSWLVVWVIAWLASPEAAQALGQYGWIIPMLNTLAVFFKKYFDAYGESKK